MESLRGMWTVVEVCTMAAVGEKAKKKADFSCVETRQVRWVMNEITNVTSFY